MPLATDKNEQIQTGTITEKGAMDPAALRNVSSVVGMSVMEAVLMTTNIHMLSVAVSGERFCFCSFSMAESPRGVAALESPKRFAVILITMACRALLPSGSEGNKKRINGESKRSIFAVMPASSATDKSPVHRHIIPKRDNTSSTAFSVPLNTAAVTASVVPAKNENM